MLGTTDPDDADSEVIVAETATTDTEYDNVASNPVNVHEVVLTEQRLPPGINVATYVVIVDFPDRGSSHFAVRAFEAALASDTLIGALTVT